MDLLSWTVYVFRLIHTIIVFFFAKYSHNYCWKLEIKMWHIDIWSFGLLVIFGANFTIFRFYYWNQWPQQFFLFFLFLYIYIKCNRPFFMYIGRTEEVKIFSSNNTNEPQYFWFWLFLKNNTLDLIVQKL